MSERITQAAISQRAGVSERTVSSWVIEGMPTDSEAAAAWWVAARRAEQIEKLKKQRSMNEAELRARKLAAEAETAEEKLAILRGQYVPIEHVEDALSQLGTAIKAVLRGLHQSARRLYGRPQAEIAAHLRKIGNELLEEIASIEFRRSARDRDHDGSADVP